MLSTHTDTSHRQGYRLGLADALRRGSQKRVMEREEVIRTLLTEDRDSEEYATAAAVGRRLIGEPIG